MTNLQFIATFSAMMICIMWLSACTGTGGQEKDTGSLMCLGFCDLKIDRSDVEVEIRSDGTRIERHKRSGLKTSEHDNGEDNDKAAVDSDTGGSDSHDHGAHGPGPGGSMR